ncbi:MAG: succinate dehydrogenase (quinone) flavoprotein subunit, partial [Verrucomicrobiae bacterium]|nr:succinate dehydrogenase (quinone) flavoprotein subunit [Verrucomicrobiae bacterium]
AAPGIIYLLDRMGVPFNRTAEGFLDFRRFGGTLHHRTAYAGATTGQQLLYSLDEQVRRYEVVGKVQKYEFWEFLSAVIDDQGVCRGIVAVHLRDLSLKVFKADAVVMAVGGPGAVFGRTTMSVQNTGSAAAAVYRQGVKYANGEFIQVHPTAIPGADKLRLISESARGEGGRVWVPKDKNEKRKPADIPESERWYFLEEKYPKYKNLVPRDIATREIFQIVYEQGWRIDGQPCVYLDVSHIDEGELRRKLLGILEIYEKFTGDDPYREPMKIFPAVHYSMGGLWVDYDQMTNVPGLFAVGECEFQYHGANRLGANSLLSCIYAGLVVGTTATRYQKHQKKATADVDSTVFDRALQEQDRKVESLRSAKGNENPFKLHQELGDLMTANVTIVRDNKRLRETEGKIADLKERYRRIGLSDTDRWANQVLPFAWQLDNMLELARVITRCALQRDESRGAHYKPEFPFLQPPAPKPGQTAEERKASPEYQDFLRKFKEQNQRWLKTTIAEFEGAGAPPRVSYEAVDTSLYEPEPRDYSKTD